MKKLINRCFLVLLTFSITACELDFKPEDENRILTDEAFNSVEDVELALIGTYSNLRAGAALGAVSHWVGGVMADEAIISDQQANTFQNQQIVNRDFNFQNTTIASMWDEMYRTINRANNVMLEVENFATGAQRDQIRGEALFIRGLCHFELIRYFAFPYEEGQLNDQLGIPLRLEASRSITQIQRSTVQEVYDQIIVDLMEARDLMSSAVPGRASAMAAQALLAKVYFQQNDFENAFTEANAVINQGIFSLNAGVSDLWQIDHSPESIFEFNSIVADDAGSGLVGAYEPVNNFLFANQSTGELISNDVSDSRSNWVNVDGNVYEVVKYALNNVNGDPVINVPLIKLSEILLIRAEAGAAIANGASDLDNAAADLQLVRSRAFGDPALMINYSDATDLITQIRNERRIEMAFEWSNRFHELKRTKQDVRGLPYNSCDLLFKIPNTETNGNPSIQQNDC